ncbi:hypothetical protein B0G81_7132 [Paraburkholderia sp. BL6665CI2N2]|uniref:hypothetical protein n=1 Tax=Paraburkholderia sp. BL6665CI2N2 TaxID=1938806 RepID=UPI0010DBC4E7|nr:hypothetical protein [Paraburkholderia sp. BL6665CI2N2]TDY26611.1 hypothetical protein B0G81_7132 [Paraburkholderia sp. BL6665CI2N2]
MPRAWHAALARMLCASAACVCLASGGAALVMQAGLGRHATELWMSALMLAAMMSVPLLMSRSSGRTTLLASAATLIVTISAMNSVPAYLSDSAHGMAIAVLMIATGVVMLLNWLRANAERRHNVERGTQQDSDSIKAATPSSATAFLALLAGLSSGSLARFQLFAICGVSGAQPFWRISLSLAAVCVLALIADRLRGNRLLIALYIARATLIGTLAANDNPALAPLAAAVFLILDCVTIPALANLRGITTSATSVLSASCPGVAHHIGMLLGAALSTTPYFFGEGFVLLYALSATANVICAASLATRWRARRHVHPRLNPFRRQTNPSG